MSTAYLGYIGSIESDGVGNIAAALNAAMNEGYEEVYLSMSSPGGMMDDGFFLYNYIRSLPIKVIAHNIGAIRSTAVVIFLSAMERYCSKRSLFMTHTSRIPGLEERPEMELVERNRHTTFLREHTNLPDDLLNRDAVITPEQALEYGIVNGIKELSIPKGSKVFQITGGASTVWGIADLVTQCGIPKEEP